MIDAISLLTSRASGAGASGADRLLGPQQPPVGGAGAPTFADVFEQVSRDAVQSLRDAEVTSISAIQGKASTREAVEAIKSAEQTLYTATAVRDKIVQAYQEISRMAI